MTHIGLVLLAESVCCTLFGSLDNTIYHQTRPSTLPQVDWEKGLNSSDPLKPIPGVTGNPCLHKDMVSYWRLQKLTNCLNGGPWTVYRRNSRFYYFQLFSQTFRIPPLIAEAWKMTHKSEVFVDWEVMETRHPHPFAPAANEDDPGRGIGIRVFRPCRTEEEQESEEVEFYWQTLESRDAVRVPTFLYDYLKGNIVGKEYHWDTEKVKYVFGKPQGTPSEVLNQDLEPVHRTLPYNWEIDFKFHDPNRMPETMPDELKKPETKLDEPTRLPWPTEEELLEDLAARIAQAKRLAEQYLPYPGYHDQYNRTGYENLKFSDIMMMNGIDMIVDHKTPPTRGFPRVSKGRLLIYQQHFSGILKQEEAYDGEYPGIRNR